ncbi:MAG TPA: geranylgeranylglycerol-phosphate geranylgeranyltransferase [Bacteroidales bacterium]|nr:geranylgeranylglycerol-phosphate geranylgeranyltransferase [Bacteroidales bacterium]
MKRIRFSGEYALAVIRLLRLPNLLIILLTQFFIRYCILGPLLYGGDRSLLLGIFGFVLMAGATVLIAAGGNIINDYHDVPADQVNRPGKNPFEKTVGLKTGMILYAAVTGAGILAGACLAFLLKSMLLGLVFPCIAILLWFYSTRYKQMLLTGNLVVSFLSALVLLIVWYTEFLHLRLFPDRFADLLPQLKVINTYVAGYALFAFLVTLIREIIKDLEDEEGDRHVGCRTLPILAGRKVTVWVVTGLAGLTALILAYAMVVLWIGGNALIFWYFAATVQAPLIYLAVKLFSAAHTAEYHFLSNLCKIIMVAGILSMQLI